MTDSENRDKKPKVLGLKGGTNTVRQSFSHGRSKSVVVETRKKKLLISKKGPVAEDNDKNNLSKIETKENEEILRRRKAIEASKVEEKKLQEQTKENKKIQEKELKPIEVKDKVKIPDTFSLETQDLNGSKKRTKNESIQKTSFENKAKDNSEKPNFKATKLNENKRRSAKAGAAEMHSRGLHGEQMLLAFVRGNRRFRAHRRRLDQHAH